MTIDLETNVWWFISQLSIENISLSGLLSHKKNWSDDANNNTKISAYIWILLALFRKNMRGDSFPHINDLWPNIPNPSIWAKTCLD